MKDSTGSLELLQHIRHDWMNRLQVIKGNLELSNIERAKKVIEEIIIEVRQEAQLSSLGVPQFAEFLLTYNWSRSAQLAIKYELLTEDQIPVELDSTIVEWIKTVVNILERSVPRKVENELYLIFQVDNEKGTIQFTLEYDGGPLSKSPKELLSDIQGPGL